MALNPLSARERQKALTALNFASVADLLADREQYRPGQILFAGQEYKYEVAPVAASDHHLTTAGGVKLYVRPVSGRMYVEAFGSPVNEAVLVKAIAAAQVWVNSERQMLMHRPGILACTSQINIANTVAIGAIASPLRGLNLEFGSAFLKAVPGGNLNAANPVLRLSIRGAHIDLPVITGERIASCLLTNNFGENVVTGLCVKRPVKFGFGAKITGSAGNTVFFSPWAQELDPTDPEFSNNNNFQASAFVADCADFRVVDASFSWAKYPLELTAGAVNTQFQGIHIWNDDPSGTNPRPHTVNIKSRATAINQIFDAYLDNGYVEDHGGCLWVQGRQLIVPSRVTLTDPIVKVYCTPARNGQSPNLGQYSLIGASVGYLKDPDSAANWGGDYTGLAGLYERMRAERGTVNAAREQTTIYHDGGSRFAHEFFRPGGSVKWRFRSGDPTHPIDMTFNTPSGSVPSAVIDSSILRVRSPYNGISEVLMGDGAVGIRQVDGSRSGVLGLRHTSTVNVGSLPTSDAGLVSGDIWRDGVELRIVP